MKRIALTDGSNTWFDADKATKYEEMSRWDGNNWISVATGSQWYHEHLYQTSSGKWVMNSWSDYSGQLGDHYRQVSVQEAYDWLVKNHKFEDLPDAELDAREVGVGDPSSHMVTIPPELFNQLKAVALVEGLEVNTLLGTMLNEFVARHRIDTGEAIA